jgi:hypothetical protein
VTTTTQQEPKAGAGDASVPNTTPRAGVKRASRLFLYVALGSTVLALVVFLFMLFSLMKSDSNRATQDKPSAAAPTSAPAAGVTAASPLDDKLRVADASPYGKQEAGFATDLGTDIMVRFNAAMTVAWGGNCFGPEAGGPATYPTQLWGFIENTAPNGPYAGFIAGPCGQVRIKGLNPVAPSDPQADIASTSRWYDLEMISQGGSTTDLGPVLFRLYRKHWLLVGTLDPGTKLNSGTGNPKPAEASPGFAAQLAAQMEAVRQQAFVQHSTKLLEAYYDPSEYQDTPQASFTRDQREVEAGASTSVNKVEIVHTNWGKIDARVTETIGDGVVTRNVSYVFDPSKSGTQQGRWVAYPQ